MGLNLLVTSSTHTQKSEVSRMSKSKLATVSKLNEPHLTEASGSTVNTSYPSQIFEKVAETLKK